jgi:hypothetical protein
MANASVATDCQCDYECAFSGLQGGAAPGHDHDRHSIDQQQNERGHQ